MDLQGCIDFYLKLSFAIVPAIYGKKRPSVEWKKYQEKAPSEKQVREWFAGNKPQNIAVVCGVPSANLVVLDFDDPTIYPKFFDTSKIEKETLVVKTGSGKPHVYLRSKNPIASFAIPQLKLEVRSDKNLVIAPTSKHPSGELYTFINQADKLILVDDLEETVWRKAEKLGVKRPRDFILEDSSYRGEQAYEGGDPPCIEVMLRGVKEGTRNHVAVRLCAYWLWFRREPKDKVKSLLNSWNARNDPPLPNSELKDVFKAALGFQRSYGCPKNQAWCNIEKCALKRNQLLRRRAEEEAEQILNNPKVLDALTPHLDNIVAGEDANKQLTFILCLSGKCKDPKMKQIVLFKAEAGAGKTRLMRIANAFKTKSVGRFTSHALDYSDLQDYEILKLKELGAMDKEFQGVSTLKFVSSDDEGYTVECTERDERGRFTTRQHKVPPITLLSSTTRISLDPQFERRAWIVNPDESEEQTERIRRWKARHEREKALVALALLKETSADHSMRILRAVAEKLEPLDVVLSFPDTVTKILKSKRLRIRGDFDKVLSLVKLHALLYQRHLPRARANGRKVVFVTPKSAVEALELAEKPFITMTTELGGRSRKIIKTLKKEYLDKKHSTITHETREKIAVQLNRSDATVYKFFKEWCSAGYMSMTKDTTKKGSPVTFKLLHDISFVEGKNAVTFDDLNAKTKIGLDMQKEAKSWLDGIIGEITLVDGYSEKTLKQAMVFNSSQISPSVEQVLTTMPSGQEPSVSSETGQVLVFASKTQTVDNPIQKNNILDGKKLLSIIELDEPYRGKCVSCNQLATLCYQITNFKDEWGYVCNDCAANLQKGMQTRREAT